MLNRREDLTLGGNAAIGISIRSSSSGCKMRVWYWLSNAQFGKLNIHKREAVGSEWKLLLSVIEITSNWARVDAEIPVSSSSFQVIIEGVLGSDRDGFLTIDDVSFTRECQIDENAIISTVKTSTTTTAFNPQQSTTNGQPITDASGSPITDKPTPSNPQPLTTGSNDCPKDYCKNGGTCLIKNQVFSCACPPQTSGDKCQVLVIPNKGHSDGLFIPFILF